MPTASVNSLAMLAEMVVPGASSEVADAVRVADHEGHRHGLAERAAQTQHDAADDAGARIRQHHVPDDFPLRRAEAVGRLLQRARRGQKHLAHHRGDERQHHDGEHEPGGQQTDAIGRPAKQPADAGQIAEVPISHGCTVCCSTGASTNSPQMPNTMLGTAASSSMAAADRPAQPQRAGLGQEHGDAERQRHGDAASRSAR